MTLKKTLKKWFENHRKIAILGIGNPLRKDDFVSARQPAKYKELL